MSTVFREHMDGLGGQSRTTYTFSVNGGGVGTILLPAQYENGAIIVGGFLDVLTPPTSGGSATIALGLNTTTDLLGATAIASITGRVALIPNFVIANMVKLTAVRRLQMTIATAALTGGAFDIHLYYAEQR